ncbi:hypothetical protein ABW20_dc0105610 [Dactylellina cionopaga]|nr:hypothetical protein ABW20_dc0105610 [Dactylellina cionopaga]
MRPHIVSTLVLSLTFSVLPSAHAFWMRVLWKNYPNGQEVINTFDTSSPDPAKVSMTKKYPSGAYQYRLISDLAGPKGPKKPELGIINIVNSERLGTNARYLMFYENNSCERVPTMFIKIMLPGNAVQDPKTYGGTRWFFDLMDRGIPILGSWKEANLKNEVDAKLVAWFDTPDTHLQMQTDNPTFVLLYMPEQNGVMRWRTIVKAVEIPLDGMKGASDAKIERSMARGLGFEYASWWAKEQAYLEEQQNLDTIFESPGFNFIPESFSMGAIKMAGYLAEETAQRLGSRIPQIDQQAPERGRARTDTTAKNTRTNIEEASPNKPLLSKEQSTSMKIEREKSTGRSSRRGSTPEGPTLRRSSRLSNAAANPGNQQSTGNLDRTGTQQQFQSYNPTDSQLQPPNYNSLQVPNINPSEEVQLQMPQHPNYQPSPQPFSQASNSWQPSLNPFLNLQLNANTNGGGFARPPRGSNFGRNDQSQNPDPN